MSDEKSQQEPQQESQKEIQETANKNDLSEHISILTALGYDEKMSIDLLKKHHNDVELVLNILENQILTPSLPPSLSSPSLSSSSYEQVANSEYHNAENDKSNYNEKLVGQAIGQGVGQGIGHGVGQSVADMINMVMSSMTSSGEYKMVLVVREDLGMKKGKIAAQCCHAAVGAYRNIIFGGGQQNKLHKKYLDAWESSAETKICLRVKSEQELLSIKESASKAGLNVYMVIDAGRTQIPAMSKTVLAIGPAPVQEIDKITSHLKLM